MQFLFKSIFIFLFFEYSLSHDDLTQMTIPENQQFLNDINLVEPDLIHLYWNHNETDITFELVSKHKGWISFGISPNGGMSGSDVIVGWLNSDGTHHFTDRHINDTNVLVDKEQNWHLLSMTSSDSNMHIKFTRKLKICDSTSEDLDIDIGTPHLIFAYGSTFINGDIGYHGRNRSSKVVPLLSKLKEQVKLNMNEIETHDFRVNRTIAGIFHTEYYCQVYKLPKSWFDVKRHIVRYETVHFPAQNKQYMHHWNIYECDDEYETVYLKNNKEPEPSYCESLHLSQNLTEKWPEINKYCSKITFVWTVGGDTILDFPSNVAYPIGGPKAEFKYFVLETHYHNPSLDKNIPDNSGIRFYATKNYRENEFGVYTVGADFHWNSILVPPNANNFLIDIYCRSDCLDQLHQTNENIYGEVKIFGSMFHTHQIGREAYTIAIRNDKEVKHLFKNKNYDFNYQYYTFLNEPYALKKGDNIKVNCVYNTLGVNNYVKGGITAYDEMCQVFLMYYPRNTNMVRCKEKFELDTWKEFLIQLNKTGEIKLTGLNLNENDIPKDILNAVPTQSLIEKIQEFHLNAKRTQLCIDVNGGANAKKTYGLLPIEASKLEDNYCSVKQETSTNSNQINGVQVYFNYLIHYAESILKLFGIRF